MAKKKLDIQEPIDVLDNVQEAQASVLNEDTQIVEQKVSVKQECQNKDVPAYVDNLLKIYSCYPSLYIDVKGGVYTEDAQPIVRGESILYKNPYYKQ